MYIEHEKLGRVSKGDVLNLIAATISLTHILSVGWFGFSTRLFDEYLLEITTRILHHFIFMI